MPAPDTAPPDTAAAAAPSWSDQAVRVAAGNEWSRRVEAEYRSAALTSHLAHWLVQVGASHDLIRLAFEVASDELAHAELSHAVVLDAARDPVQTGRPAEDPVAPGPRPGPVAVDRDALALPRAWEPLELDLTASALETFALGETVAVPLFRRLRANARVGSARAALDRILADEVRHRDFGWLLLETLFSGPHGELCRDFATAILPDAVGRLAQSYGAHPDERALPEGLLAWGLMPGSDYAAALGEATARELVPRLSALGFSPAALSPFERLAAWARPSSPG